jgi:ribose transport system substrate-binding protein
MPKLRLVSFVSLAAAVALTAGCTTGSSDPVTPNASGGAQDAGGLAEVVDPSDARDLLYGSMEGKKIVFVPQTLQVDLISMWGEQFKSIFESLGAEYSEFDAGNDVDAQIRMIDSAIDDEVDLVIIQNPDAGVLSTQVERAHENGIYVIGVNVQGSQSADAFVGADYRSMAEDLAEHLADECDAAGKTQVAIMTGFATDDPSVKAEAGFTAVFDERGLEIVSTQATNYDPTRANEIASAVLQQNPDLCGFALSYDLTALGVAQAIEAAGMQDDVLVYNIDASKTWCDALAAGRVDVGVAFNASGISAAAAFAAQDLFLVGAPAGSRRVMGFVPYALADQSNYETIPGACYGS